MNETKLSELEQVFLESKHKWKRNQAIIDWLIESNVHYYMFSGPLIQIMRPNGDGYYNFWPTTHRFHVRDTYGFLISELRNRQEILDKLKEIRDAGNDFAD